MSLPRDCESLACDHQVTIAARATTRGTSNDTPPDYIKLFKITQYHHYNAMPYGHIT